MFGAHGFGIGAFVASPLDPNDARSLTPPELGRTVPHPMPASPANPPATPSGRSSGRIVWTTTRTARVGDHDIPTGLAEPIHANPEAGHGQVAGIRADAGVRGGVKRLLRPAARLWSWWLVDGFVARRMGRWIAELARPDDVFLEVGCGNMQLRRYLPRSLCYNAVDIAFSQHDVNLAMREAREVNLAFGSAYALPVADAQASLVVCNQVLHQTPQPERILDELHRIARPDARVLLGVHNSLCRKYQAIGAHPDTINGWTVEQFQRLVEQHGFRCRRTLMTGRWIPLPRRLAGARSYHLPISSKREEDNTHFFFLLERSVRPSGPTLALVRRAGQGPAG
ncbi:MAG: methyltransferase domain-containing protein [Phycisphaerales bacterium]